MILASTYLVQCCLPKRWRVYFQSPQNHMVTVPRHEFLALMTCEVDNDKRLFTRTENAKAYLGLKFTFTFTDRLGNTIMQEKLD